MTGVAGIAIAMARWTVVALVVVVVTVMARAGITAATVVAWTVVITAALGGFSIFLHRSSLAQVAMSSAIRITVRTTTVAVASQFVSSTVWSTPVASIERP